MYVVLWLRPGVSQIPENYSEKYSEGHSLYNYFFAYISKLMYVTD